MERIVLLARSEEVRLIDLPESLRSGRPLIGPTKIALENEGIGLEAVEREMIVQALRKFNWNQTQAAHYLDVSRKTLMYRIAKYGIEKESSKSGPDLSKGVGS
jgi:two-component system NtrC family response regulator